ncbi:MAG TPA: hypothetical protein VIL98_13095 [Gaiellaceae bacterium]
MQVTDEVGAVMSWTIGTTLVMVVRVAPFVSVSVRSAAEGAAMGVGPTYVQE